jgi:hypothetical protein
LVVVVVVVGEVAAMVVAVAEAFGYLGILRGVGQKLWRLQTIVVGHRLLAPIAMDGDGAAQGMLICSSARVTAHNAC